MADSMVNDAPCQDYLGPVGQLLTIGAVDLNDPAKWPDYPAQYELGQEHISELTRMACDVALHNGDPVGAGVWAPIHAWRALGQLRATESVDPLLAAMYAIRESEAPYEELADVFAMIGPDAIPRIAAFLREPALEWALSATASSGLTKIVERHPESRDACVAVLTQILERAAETDPTANGFTIGSLLDLKAVEAIDEIREAFRQDTVDISIAGDLEDVEIDLGLRERRTKRKPYYPFESRMFASDTLASGTGFGGGHREVDATPRPGKIGRNELCPCGSGKKYKKCCLE